MSAAARVAAALTAALAAACFSERSGPAGPALAADCALPLDSAAVGATVVVIRDFAFHPAEVRVPAGGRVVWINCEPEGSAAHTATANGGAWGSALLERGERFALEFTDGGGHDYHCEPHPFMRGRVVVE